MDVMERLAPIGLAEDWDNAGLQIGHREKSVTRVMVALDPSMAVIKNACDKRTDLLITHHPLIFKPIRSLDLSSPLGKIVALVIKKDLSIFSAHTNLDSVNNGINDVLAEKIGLTDVTILDKVGEGNVTDSEINSGLGRIGYLKEKMNLYQFADNMKSKLGLDCIKVVGDQNLVVEQVALCCGSGSSLVGKFFSSSAQVFVSGDLKYHDARDAEMLNRGLVDIGHFASEHLILDVLAEKIHQLLTQQKMEVWVDTCDIESDPFITL